MAPSSSSRIERECGDMTGGKVKGRKGRREGPVRGIDEMKMPSLACFFSPPFIPLLMTSRCVSLCFYDRVCVCVSERERERSKEEMRNDTNCQSNKKHPHPNEKQRHKILKKIKLEHDESNMKEERRGKNRERRQREEEESEENNNHRNNNHRNNNHNDNHIIK